MRKFAIIILIELVIIIIFSCTKKNESSDNVIQSTIELESQLRTPNYSSTICIS